MKSYHLLQKTCSEFITGEPSLISSWNSTFYQKDQKHRINYVYLIDLYSSSFIGVRTVCFSNDFETIVTWPKILPMIA